MWYDCSGRGCEHVVNPFDLLIEEGNKFAC